MSAMTISVTRATAIACLNAAITHLKLGLFISEYSSVDDHSLRWGKFAGNATVTIKGRTDKGEYIYSSNTVLFKNDRGQKFPVEKVYVSLHESSREGMANEHIYFECVFADDGIKVTKLEKSPHEDEATHWPAEEEKEMA